MMAVVQRAEARDDFRHVLPSSLGVLPGRATGHGTGGPAVVELHFHRSPRHFGDPHSLGVLSERAGHVDTGVVEACSLGVLSERADVQGSGSSVQHGAGFLEISPVTEGRRAGLPDSEANSSGNA